MRTTPTRHLGRSSRPDLIEGNLRLGLEDDALGHAGLLAAGRIGGPVLRQIEPIGDRQAGRGGGDRQRHSDLAVVLLAQLARGLAGAPPPNPAPLWESGGGGGSAPEPAPARPRPPGAAPD